MTTPSVRQVEDTHSAGGVVRRPVTIVRGVGARLWDAEGKEYLDCASAHGWANLGHGHPDILAALHEQAGTLITLNESAYNPQRAEWFTTLSRVLAARFPPNHHGPLTRIYPCNSGAEAMEGALKFARFRTGRAGFVAFKRGFHGRTMGALSVTAARAYRQPFEPLLPGVTHIAFNEVAAVDRAVNDDTAAVVLEIVQGEGGVHEAHPDFVAETQRICRDRGALLIVDEVQTGFGRTGRWFASEHVGGAPDVLVLGKALGGGLPMGATVWREGLGTFEPGAHGSTFGGAPLACAASVATMRVLERDGLPERAAAMGAALHAALEGCAPVVRGIRGKGFMIGVQLRANVTPVLKGLLARGVWALPAGKTVLRLLPPLIITEDELDRAKSIVLETLNAV